MRLEETLRNRRRPLQIVGVGSVLEAALALKHGADGIWLSSLCLSLNEVLPDEDLVSVERITRDIVAIRRFFEGPVLVDGGVGGSLPRLAHLVRACEAGGASGLCIEDAGGPKRNSLAPGHTGLRDATRFCERLRLLSRAQAGGRLARIARTEGLLAGLSVQETIARARQYVDVGVEALFVHASNRAQFLQFATRWRGGVPLIACPTRFPELSIEDAHDHGVAVILYANHGMRACYKALDETFAAMLHHGTAGVVEQSIAPFDTILNLTASQPRGRVDSAFIAQALCATNDAPLAIGDDGELPDLAATA